jgi:FkbM family methyltransferase
MLLDFDSIYRKYNLKVKGVIHIGAHYGQENELYKRHNIKNKIFFEPLPHVFTTLKSKVNDAILVNKALGSKKGKVEMYVEFQNNSQSSSVLKPKLHVSQYPWIKFENKITVDMTTLDDYLSRLPIEFNFINMDVQGYELEVMKGSVKTLEKIDYIISEVNKEELYENCVRVEQLDEFLSRFEFKRVETTWEGVTWGDALYIKDKQE